MMTKLFLKPLYLPLSSLCPKFLFIHNKHSVTKFSFSTIATTSGNSNSQTQFTDPNIVAYGPSLQKGTRLTQFPINNNPEQEEGDNDILDEGMFTRVFDISALRVPSKDCFTLESRLRGHLLNWPRIRNIARVPGDEIDPELVELIGSSNGDSDGEGAGLVSLHRRIHGKAEGDGEVLSPVLYRDMLAKTFNSRGFVKFKNLAKISRPKKKKKKKRGEENIERNRRVHKNDFALVEVVEDEEEESEHLKNLLGEEFNRKKWRGSTRLLLLDERYAGKCEEELPEAIKVAVPTL